MAIEIIDLVIIASLIFLGYYIRKKGDNQADKEDLEHLTTIVEEVKQKYSEEIEVLKNELSIQANKKNLVFSEEKEAIITYFSNVNEWIWSGLKGEIEEFTIFNIDQLTDVILRLRENHSKTNLAFAKLQLLIKDKELVKNAHSLNMETLSMHNFELMIIRNLTLALNKEETAYNFFKANPMEKEVNMYPPDISEPFYKKEKEGKEDRDQIVAKYFDRHKKYFNPIIKERDQFLVKAQSYLNS